MEKRHYKNIDGLRAICCFGIIAMHIQANTSYEVDGFFYNNIIPSWTLFVYLFLIISGFAMSCGYFEAFKEGKIDLEKFYIKRYAKILPFFALLVGLDVILERSKESLFEGIVELTMVYGLLPNNSLNVIGVSWTLGVIFLFYMLFPFFVFLLKNKRRAWFSFAISIAISYMCEAYFFTDKFVVADFTARHSFLYCVPYFICGGIVYLYREKLYNWINKFAIVQLVISIVITILFYTTNLISGTIGMLLLFASWLILCIGKDNIILSNKVAKFLGGISMEMYLAHMVIFRLLEKTGVVSLFGSKWYGYCLVFILTVIILISFIYCYKFVTQKINALAKGYGKNS